MDQATPAIEQEYRARLAARRSALAARERTHLRFSQLRLAIAASAGVLLLVRGLDGLPWLLVPLAAFVVAAVLHGRVLNARDRAVTSVTFYERGLGRLGDEWIGQGRTGDRYRDPAHLYAEDLDIFGRGSLFELLATTRTQAGEDTLAAWLLAPAPAEVVRARQEAVRELAGRLDLREAIAILGDGLRVGVNARALRAWAIGPIRLRGFWPRVALAALSAAAIASIAVWAVTGSSPALVGIAVVGLGLVARLLQPRVLQVIESVDAPSHDLDLLAGLLRTIEREPFESAHLVRLRDAIAGAGRPASAEIARLSQLVALLESRANVIAAVPAALMLWATQCAFAIEAWRARTGAHVPRWLDAAGELEALIALATFAAEHPGYPYPEFVEGPAMVTARRLAHPALPPSAVANDVQLDAQGTSLLIVSGSNMSGKSTLLRALGVNVVLASMGAPVRAAQFRLSPLALGAAIRIQDSLTEGTSRFFAEITRLKQIVDVARSRHGAVLVLLDEILAGTNSHDRRLGAEALLTGLVAEGAIGLVTTHDLALGAIADRLPGRAANVHFEDHFADGILTFDYRLRPGVVQTSSAVALMRSIGLEV